MLGEKEKLGQIIEVLKTELISSNETKNGFTNFDLLKVCQQLKIEEKEKVLELSHEFLEVAVNHYLQQKYRIGITSNVKRNKIILNDLEQLENQIPVKSWRNSEQQLLQQFSTPPQIAFLMATLLNPTPGDLILEPSAGTGSLAVWLKLMGCNLHLNELSELRRNLLELQGFQPTSYNAEFINDFITKGTIPDGVLMNPPFSTTAGRVKSKDSNFGFQHIKSALERLKEGGKIVALFSTNALTKSEKGKRFIKELSDEYWLKALIDLPKTAYYKYGTNIQVTIICLKKAKPQKGAENTININCSTLAEVLRFANIFDE